MLRIEIMIALVDALSPHHQRMFSQVLLDIPNSELKLRGLRALLHTYHEGHTQTESVLFEATLAAAKEMGWINSSHELAYFLSYAPNSQIPQLVDYALELTNKLEHPFEKCEYLLELLPYMSIQQQTQAVDCILEWHKDVDDSYEGEEYIRKLADMADLLSRTGRLEAVYHAYLLAGSPWHHQVKALIKLQSKLTETDFAKALDGLIARIYDLEDNRMKALGLSNIFAISSSAQREEFIQTIVNITDAKIAYDHLERMVSDFSKQEALRWFNIIFDWKMDIKEELARLRVLILIIPKLPDDERENACRDMLRRLARYSYSEREYSIPDYDLSDLYTLISAILPEQLFARLLDDIREIRLTRIQVNVLIEMWKVAPDRYKESIVSQINYLECEKRAEGLRHIAELEVKNVSNPELANMLLRQSLAAATQIAGEISKRRALEMLLPLLPNTMLQEVFDCATSFQKESCFHLIVSIAQRASQPLRNLAIEYALVDTRSIHSQKSFADMLAKLACHLTPKAWPEFIELFSYLSNWDIVSIFGEMPDSMKSLALIKIEASVSTDAWDFILRNIVKYLPVDLYDKVFAMAMKLQDGTPPVGILIELVPVANESLRQKIGQTAERWSNSYALWSVRCELAKYQSVEERLKTIQGISDDIVERKFGLVAELISTLPEDLQYQIWSKFVSTNIDLVITNEVFTQLPEFVQDKLLERIFQSADWELKVQELLKLHGCLSARHFHRAEKEIQSVLADDNLDYNKTTRLKMLSFLATYGSIEQRGQLLSQIILVCNDMKWQRLGFEFDRSIQILLKNSTHEEHGVILKEIVANMRDSDRGYFVRDIFDMLSPEDKLIGLDILVSLQDRDTAIKRLAEQMPKLTDLEQEQLFHKLLVRGAKDGKIPRRNGRNESEILRLIEYAHPLVIRTWLPRIKQFEHKWMQIYGFRNAFNGLPAEEHHLYAETVLNDLVSLNNKKIHRGRGNLFQGFAVAWSKSNFAGIADHHEIWCEVIHTCGLRGRWSCYRELSELLPWIKYLGGSSAIEEVLVAARDVEQWWA